MIKQLEHVKASPSTDLAILAVTSEENFDLLKTFTDLGLDLGEIDIDEEDEYGFTALQWAVASQKFKAVKYLISKGADVNHRSKLGLTPLFQATGRAPDVKIAKILINHGADVMAKTPTGSVPLHGASLQGKLLIVRFKFESDCFVEMEMNTRKCCLLNNVKGCCALWLQLSFFLYMMLPRKCFSARTILPLGS